MKVTSDNLKSGDKLKVQEVTKPSGTNPGDFKVSNKAMQDYKSSGKSSMPKKTY